VKKFLFQILDILLLFPGMALISYGVYQIYRPAGFIMSGLCLAALAFFVAKKQARGR
jgi:hypothetical protein